MVPQASLQSTADGLVPAGEGWFVLNAREAPWLAAEGRSAVCPLEGEPELPQVGVNVSVLEPGQAMAMYHWEADQENFLVLAGQALLIIEGTERALAQWDFVHCPAGTKHTIVGAGVTTCVVVGIGARDRSTGPDWGGYTVDAAASRHGASVNEDTTDPPQAYAGLPRRKRCRYRDGWLP